MLQGLVTRKTLIQRAKSSPPLLFRPVSGLSEQASRHGIQFAKDARVAMLRRGDDGNVQGSIRSRR